MLTDVKFESDDDINQVFNLEEFIKQNKDTKEEIFVIGGGMVYRQMLPYSKKMYLTEIDAICNDAQVYFPNFDKTEFERKELYKNSDNGINYTHVEYIRK